MSEFSYNDVLKLIPKARPRKFPEPQCDPIIEHCIKLRKFHDEIDHLILLTANLKEIYEDSEREPILKSLPPVPELPELVNSSPNKNQKNLPLKEIELSEETVMKLVTKAVARVMFILGYTDMPSHVLQKLSKMIVDYVRSLCEMMVELMPEDSSISVDLLEVALQQKGISGIGELYSFYTQRIVKFHDRLYLKCQHFYDELKNNLKKPDAPPEKNITQSSIPEDCSTDVHKVRQNNEEDSSKNSLDAGVLAEDLFSRKKLKRKSVRFAPQTENIEMSSLKNSHEAKIAESPAENTVYSESFSNLENVLTEGTVKCTKLDSNLSSKPSSAINKNSANITGSFCHSSHYSDGKPSDCDASIVTDDDKGFDKNVVCYFDDEPVDGVASKVTNEEKTPDRNVVGSELSDESLDLGACIIGDEEKYHDKNTIGSEFIDEQSGIVTDEELFPDKTATGSKSYSKSDNSSTKNTVTIECTKPYSDLSTELNHAVSKICNMSSDYFNNKPVRSCKAKRKSVDLESLDDSSTGNRKKRYRLMKHKKVSENDTTVEVMSPTTKLPLSSSAGCNEESKLNKNELGIISEENICNNHLSPETNSEIEISSSNKSGSEIINSVPDASSSSENETEQIWVSL